MPRKQILILSFAVEGLLVILAIGIGLLLKMPVKEWIAWSLSGLAWGAGGMIALLALLALCRRSRLRPLRKLMHLVDTQVKPLFRDCSIFDLLVISILAGICEELFFRGFLPGLLENWLSPGPTLVITSALFGLAHCISKEYAVFAALLGLLLGGLVILTGDLLASILAHTGYDFVALLILTQRSRTGPSAGES
jgi:membrane protease YdiL (CAAX protease family)